MNTVKINVNYKETIGKIKPMHAVGQPPITGLSNIMFHYLKEAGIPFSRLHDTGGMFGRNLFVDIPNIFRDFDADENDPASYDFMFTDKIISGLMEAGCEPYFRLGVTIENYHKMKAYRIYPPKDFDKWARICEHIVRHYNEGWADGFNYGITYWEIWNEPDCCILENISAMWKGTPEEYYRLYSITARHLKECFGDSIKVGGYASCGLHEWRSDENLDGVHIPENEQNPHQMLINFMHGFFRYQKETNAPIDFFSWHLYETFSDYTKGKIREVINHADYARRVLDKYGFTNAEHHLNEWNHWCDKYHRDAPMAAAKSLGFMLMMQNTSTDLMCYYDAAIGFSDYGSLFSADNGHPYRTYYIFPMFNTLYRLENQVKCTSDNDDVYVGAAVNGKKAALVIANTSSEELDVEINIEGFFATETQILRIDEINRYTLTGESLETGKLILPSGASVEIKLWDIE